MDKVISVRVVGTTSRRVRVEFESARILNLDKEVAYKAGLRTGLELTVEQVDSLEEQDSRQKCYSAACRFLSYRPRSESEVRQRLRRRFDPSTVEAVLHRLKESRLVDDTAFAEFWVENRCAFKPRSRKYLEMELKQKGIAPDIIDRAVATDDYETAYQAAIHKSGKLPIDEQLVFRRKLVAYLQRRGFSLPVSINTAERVWQELVNEG